MKRLASLFISLAILALIYWKIDVRAIVPVFVHCDRLWMSVSLAMVVPITAATAWRLQQLMPQRGQLGFGEANRLILVASVLNLVLPSKMGDLAKAGFMVERAQVSGALAVAVVVFEKACDLLSLLGWCAFGLAWIGLTQARGLDAFHLPAWIATSRIATGPVLYWFAVVLVGGAFSVGMLLIGSRKLATACFETGKTVSLHRFDARIEKLQQAWEEMHAGFWASRRQLAKVVFASVGIWLLHLLQIWLFILSLNAYAPFLANLALSPLAILAGLLPLTFAGVGTRDVALVILYRPFFAAPTAAALGLLCTMRYVLPALGGLPFAGDYFRRASGFKGKPRTRDEIA